MSPDEITQPPTIRIPERPPVSLVDLSSSGALIEVPFALRADSRVTVEISAGSERLLVRFRTLRCSAAAAQNIARFRVAGTFERQLERIPLVRTSTPSSTRPGFTLEVHLRPAVVAAANQSRTTDFDPLLGWMLDAIRCGMPPDAIGSELRSRLERLIPAITIERATTPALSDPARSARFLGIDVRTDRVLTSTDRRVLKAAAHFLSLTA